jgi:hypothetical protein
MHLEKIRLQPEPRLTTARSANDQDVLVPGIAGILRAVAHHEQLRFRQNHVVLENRIFKRCNILMRSPGSVLSSTFFDLLTLLFH